MIRTWRGRVFWGLISLAAGSWAVRILRGRQVARVGRRVGRRVRPYAMSMATKAGRSMIDTTMRTVRAFSRR
jgi:hypothetical protein